MTTLLKNFVVAILVLGAASIFLMNMGRWDDVTEFVGIALGGEAKERIEQFGEASRDAGDALEKGVAAASNGDSPEADWSHIGSLLEQFAPPLPERHPEYRRAEFGDAWEDVDGNGCDTRNDILRRDLVDMKIDADGCRVLSGTLHDPYTGKTIQFVRGEKTSSAVQIDHIVSLSDAWDLGAWKWPAHKREQFANDPANLIAVDGPTNSGKSDKSISEWAPDSVDHWCAYAASYIQIHDKYDLAMRTEDAEVAADVIAACAG